MTRSSLKMIGIRQKNQSASAKQ